MGLSTSIVTQKISSFLRKGVSPSLSQDPSVISDYYGERLLGGQSRKETLWLTSFWGTGGSWHCPKSDSGHCHPQIHTGTSQAPGEFHQEGQWGLWQRLCSLDAKQAQLEPFQGLLVGRRTLNCSSPSLTKWDHQPPVAPKCQSGKIRIIRETSLRSRCLGLTLRNLDSTWGGGEGR